MIPHLNDLQASVAVLMQVSYPEHPKLNLTALGPNQIKLLTCCSIKYKFLIVWAEFQYMWALQTVKMKSSLYVLILLALTSSTLSKSQGASGQKQKLIVQWLTKNQS